MQNPSEPAGRRASRARIALGTATLAAVATWLPSCGESGGSLPDGPPPVVVQVVTAAPSELPRTLSAVGSLESPAMTTVAFEIAGTVVELDIPEGRLVEAGHVLARLDAAEARAAVAVARARFQNAENRLARLESLRRRDVSSEQAYDDALAEHDAAAGALDEAQTRLRKHRVRAPFAGLLGLRRVDPGQYVAPGGPVVEITKVDPIELVFSLPQRHAPQLAVGQTALGVVGRCEARFEGTVTAIDPRVDPRTRMLRLQARVANPDGALLPGMAARVRLVVGTLSDALVVPQEAIVRQGTKHIVYTVNGQNVAGQREVSLGEFSVDGVHVASGLEPGQRVVVAGQQKLRPGAAVEVRPFEPVENPNLALGRSADCDF